MTIGIVGTPHISSTPFTSQQLSLSLPPPLSLTLSLSPVSVPPTEPGTPFHHSTSPFSLHSLHCSLHWNKRRPAVEKRPFTGPQAKDNNSSSHAHNSASWPIADQAEQSELSTKGGPIKRKPSEEWVLVRMTYQEPCDLCWYSLLRLLALREWTSTERPEWLRIREYAEEEGELLL